MKDITVNTTDDLSQISRSDTIQLVSPIARSRTATLKDPNKRLPKLEVVMPSQPMKDDELFNVTQFTACL